MSIAKWLLARKLGGGSPFPPVIKRKTGNPIELTDAASAPMVKCVTEIQGSQDLHGYDKPWPPGAGKNKFNENGTYLNNKYISNDGNIADSSAERPCKVFLQKISVTPGESYTVSATSSVSAYLRTGEYMSDDTFIVRDMSVLEINPTITFVANANASYVLISPDSSCSNIMFEKNDHKTSYEPYSNICPITAYTEGEISVGDVVNVFDNTTCENLDINPSGSTSANPNRELSQIINVTSGDAYYLTNVSNVRFIGYAEYNASGDFIRRVVFDSDTSTTFIPNAPKIRLWFSMQVNTNPITTSDLDGVMLTAGNHAPTITTHTTTYPDTIYRGSEDVVNGKVTTERVKIESDGTGFLIASNGILYNDSNILTGVSSVVADLIQTITDKYSFYNIIGGTVDLVGQEGKFGLQIIGNVIRIAICDSRFTTAEDFQTYLSNNPLEIAYKLVTPTTSSVTPTNLPIKSLSGYNHIESSTGDMVVDYITDAYQNFVDTTESALPNTRKGGSKAMDIFMTLDEPGVDEPEKEVDEKEEEKK